MRLRSNIKKIRLVFLPFLLITVSFIVGYTMLNWLFLIKTHTFYIRENLVKFWLPMSLPWIPVLLWLRPRIRLLDLRGIDRHLPFLYQFVAVLAMGIPTIIAQNYIERASGKLTNLDTIDQIASFEKSKYYTLNKFSVDTQNVGAFGLRNASKNHRYFHMHIFYVLPIMTRESDTSRSDCVAWLGVKYFKRVNNRISKRDKQKEFRAFALKTRKDFDQRTFNSFSYFERVSNKNDSIVFAEAVKESPKLSKSAPVLVGIDEPFENRAGNTFAWTIAIFSIGAGLWLVMSVAPKLAGIYPDVESYVLDQPESTVLEAIRNFKSANPQHLHPEYLNLKDGRSAQNEYDRRHHLYFFYPDDYQIVYAWARPIDPVRTEIALVAINEGLIIRNWKRINKDFIGRHNERQKEKFANTILDNIKKQLETV